MNISTILTTQEIPSRTPAEKATATEFGGGIARGLLHVAQGLSDVGAEAQHIVRMENAIKEKQERIDNSNKAIGYAEQAEWVKKRLAAAGVSPAAAEARGTDE